MRGGFKNKKPPLTSTKDVNIKNKKPPLTSTIDVNISKQEIVSLVVLSKLFFYIIISLSKYFYTLIHPSYILFSICCAG
jgi:hypothetical protein